MEGACLTSKKQRNKRFRAEMDNRPPLRYVQPKWRSSCEFSSHGRRQLMLLHRWPKASLKLMKRYYTS